MTGQRRGEGGRYVHHWDGIVAQSAEGDWDFCSSCGRVRLNGGRPQPFEAIPADATMPDSDTLFWPAQEAS